MIGHTCLNKTLQNPQQVKYGTSDRFISGWFTAHHLGY